MTADVARLHVHYFFMKRPTVQVKALDTAEHCIAVQRNNNKEQHKDCTRN